MSKTDDTSAQTALEKTVEKDAKALAAKIIAEAMKEADAICAGDNAPQPVKYLPPSPEAFELVEIRLPKTKDKSGAVYVNVNEHNFLVPRGVYTKVPRYVATVLEESAAQDEATLDMIDRSASEAEQRLSKLRQL